VARGKLKWRVRNITRSYRIRVYPNGAQRRLRDRWFGAYRWLWNTALEIRTEAYRHCELTLTGNDISRWLTQWKRTPGHEWLAAVPATCLTQCLRDQDTAAARGLKSSSNPPSSHKFSSPKTTRPRKAVPTGVSRERLLGDCHLVSPRKLSAR